MNDKFLGIILFFLGGALLVQNLYPDSISLISYWPILLIIYGISRLVDLKKNTKVFDGVLILTGYVLLENNVNIFFDNSIPLFPILLSFLLIYGGVKLLFVKKKKKLSKFSMHKNIPWTIEGDNHNFFIGDVYLDFNKCILKEGENKYFIQGEVGEITLLLSDTMEYRIESEVSIGSITVDGISVREGIRPGNYKYETKNYKKADKKVFIKTNLKIGEVNISK